MNKTIGQKIRTLRQKQNKSQWEIAAALGISIPAYSKIETNITDINMPRLKQIAALFEITPESLIAEESAFEKRDNQINELSLKLSEMHTEVIELQKKLINAYEEIDDLRK